jgi:hypothetical protein
MGGGMNLVPPLVSFDTITRQELNACLIAWEHRMGPWNRPNYREWLFGLRHHGELCAVTAASDLIRENVAGFSRAEAFELGRLCAARPALNRVALRLWREFIFPVLCGAHGFSWAISYQGAASDHGDLYRFDGWVRVGFSHSGTDARSGRVGRDKIIWGWCADEAERKARRVALDLLESGRAAAA